ncbi:hypothetical protein V8J88_05925 [Massilia sp. W12]
MSTARKTAVGAAKLAARHTKFAQEIRSQVRCRTLTLTIAAAQLR